MSADENVLTILNCGCGEDPFWGLGERCVEKLTFLKRSQLRRPMSRLFSNSQYLLRFGHNLAGYFAW
jgi:hypothetical protein